MKKALTICVIALGIMLSGCAPQQSMTETSNGNEVKWLNLECFQTVNNSDDYSICLAKDYNWNVYFILHFTSPTNSRTEVYYDGKRISGKYVFVGTYSYESKGGDYKTVQAYMAKDNFEELYNYNKRGLIDLLNAVLSYTSVR